MIFIAIKGKSSKFVLKSLWKTKKFWIYDENKVEDDCQSAIICTTMSLFFLFSLSPKKWIGLKKRKDSKKGDTLRFIIYKKNILEYVVYM